jgi:hypothetical protein
VCVAVLAIATAVGQAQHGGPVWRALLAFVILSGWTIVLLRWASRRMATGGGLKPSPEDEDKPNPDAGPPDQSAPPQSQ